MTHKPIQITNLSLILPHKTCFEDFSSTIPYGSRIALIGRNGSGKSSLLSMLCGTLGPTSGTITCPEDVHIGYVPQIIDTFGSLSGGQRFNKALTEALSRDPNVLLLDEPTNHLDGHNRRSLMRLLRKYDGTLIIVSHDVEVLRYSVDTLWHIDQGHLRVFSGNYDDYREDLQRQRTSIEREMSNLDRQKKDMHHKLMQEQKRAMGSRKKGEKGIEQRKWPTIVSKAKALRAAETTGRKKAAIDHKKNELSGRLAELRLPEVIVPTFSLTANDGGDRIVLSIIDGSVGYEATTPIVSEFNLSLGGRDRIAIMGDNGSGKSTLIRGILRHKDIFKNGTWQGPKEHDIGYVDQHYDTLQPNRSVLEIIEDIVPAWTHAEVRSHLNDFLFRKNEEVNALVKHLSEGEKARLTLAQIAAHTPNLLILDEPTNNIDLETRSHVIDVLSAYPGAMIVISHDEDFLTAIGVTGRYVLKDGILRRNS